jgi:tripartite-type tricarboxylate transporter receptor subunit TctC
MKRHPKIRKFLLAAFGAMVVGGAFAAYPEKSINYIIAFNPGGESDVSARLQQPFFKKYTAQDVAIQYKAGAGGAAAWSQLNSMPGDGYTIMGTNLPHIVLQPLEKDVGYKTEELANVFFFHYTPDAIVVTADSPYKTLKDFVEAAKKAPGTITYSGSGTNSANHLAQQRFDELAGIKTTYVPFSGTGPSNTALLGKQVSAAMSYSTVGMMLGDKVRVLALATEKRMRVFPDSPTFKELGYDLVGGAYRGIAVPKDTPANVKREVSDLIGKINRDPEFIKKMEDAGFVMADVDVDQMPKFMASMQQRYEDIARAMGIIKTK